jgi:hypothetical protein
MNIRGTILGGEPAGGQKESMVEVKYIQSTSYACMKIE